MTTPTIEIADLAKTFGRVHALDGLTMTVDTGQVHGFLGPNGSGKSTTIRILLGLLRSNSGTVRILGGDPWRAAPELHRRLAYVPGDVNLWPNLTGGEAIDLLCRARGSLDRKRRDALVERFDLDPRKKGRAYSKGNRQKVALIAALASEVELLLLDEPTSGLDPLMEQVFRDIIREDQREGRTVLLSSHVLSEVEALCDRVTIIKEGRAVESGSLAELRHLHRTRVTAVIDQGLAHELAQMVGVHDVECVGGQWRAQVDEVTMPKVLARLAEARARAVTATPPTLEELFLSHYEKTT